jgi:hypothetical protein
LLAWAPIRDVNHGISCVTSRIGAQDGKQADDSPSVCAGCIEIEFLEMKFQPLSMITLVVGDDYAVHFLHTRFTYVAECTGDPLSYGFWMPPVHFATYGKRVCRKCTAESCFSRISTPVLTDNPASVVPCHSCLTYLLPLL